jgi:hypothetical protein
MVDALIKKQAQLFNLTYVQSFEKLQRECPGLLEGYSRLTKV